MFHLQLTNTHFIVCTVLYHTIPYIVCGMVPETIPGTIPRTIPDNTPHFADCPTAYDDVP